MAQSGSLGNVCMLCFGADGGWFGFGEQNQWTALHCASDVGHLEVVQHLTQCDGIELNAVDVVLHHTLTALVTVSAAVLALYPTSSLSCHWHAF